jgi:hypothetical protein
MTDAATRPAGLAAYVAVTAAYWAFMLSDGALRMLVLLQFHMMGFSPVQLAYLFVLYEIAGVLTNLSAGWIAARFGLTVTLYAGLGLQIVALLALAGLDPSWGITASVVFVMGVQGLSGVAKDLAKMSSKSAVKLLAPQTEGALFRWVALLTGSKNAVKGLGFLLGAGLLAFAGFVPAVLGMAGVLALILLVIVLRMPAGLPGGRKGAKFSQVLSRSANVNWLSAARVFLFGARDVWFVVGIPVYFYAVLSDGTVAGNRLAFFIIGSFMAGWIILYGVVQANAPRLLRALGLGAGGVAGGAGHDGRGSGRAVGLADGGSGCGAFGLWRGLRGQFGATFLPDPCLQPGRAGDDGCRLLLHGECGRSADRHAVVGPELPMGRLAGLSGGGGRDAGHQRRAGPPAAPGPGLSLH